MADVLLTVSGEIPEDLEAEVEAGRRPRPDYLALAERLPAELLDYRRMRREGGAAVRRLERTAGSNAALAWTAFRRRDRHRLILTDGEQVGIPLAALLKSLGRGSSRVRHAMIAHVLSVPKKTLFFDLLRIQSEVDRFLVYSDRQGRFIRDRWQVPPARVVFTPFQVDAGFFAPRPGPTENLICSVGRELRDYPTLIDAVEGLDLEVVVTASSLWSKREDTSRRRPLPRNVSVQRFSMTGLRDLYARSRFVVLPRYPVDFQVGVTAILEAMAMGKAVIATRIPGQSNEIVEDETGLLVPPGDPVALREAIRWLLEHPERAERMGAAGRRRVEDQMSLDRYVERLRGVARELLYEASGAGSWRAGVAARR